MFEKKHEQAKSYINRWRKEIKPAVDNCKLMENQIVYTYRRAAYTSEPTNAEAPIRAAYGNPIIGVFRITDDSILVECKTRTNHGRVGSRRPAERPTCRVQNPDTQRAGRVGTAQGGRRGRRRGEKKQGADISVA